MKAHNFSLQDQEGKPHKLSDYLGSWVIVYFYPKDDTPGCTKEACIFRDKISEYKKRGIIIIGVSKDSVASHKKFAEKYSLPFTLLSDPTHETIKAYNAWGKKKFLGREYDGIFRNTVLINPKGEVVKEYKSVNPLTHSEEILKGLDSLI